MSERILVCRPQPGADRTARTLRDAGLTPIVNPLLHITATGTPCPLPAGLVDALVVTSAQAVPYVATFSDRPAYAVGHATAEALADAGFGRVRSAGSDARALSQALPTSLARDGLLPSAQLLWPCAERTAFDMVDALHGHGVSCARWVVYRADGPARLPADTAAQLVDGTIHAVLLTSPRIAATFAALAPAIAPSVRLLCLSQAVRQALPPDLRKQAWAAPEPHEAALLSLLGTGRDGRLSR